MAAPDPKVLIAFLDTYLKIKQITWEAPLEMVINWYYKTPEKKKTTCQDIQDQIRKATDEKDWLKLVRNLSVMARVAKKESKYSELFYVLEMMICYILKSILPTDVREKWRNDERELEKNPQKKGIEFGAPFPYITKLLKKLHDCKLEIIKIKEERKSAKKLIEKRNDLLWQLAHLQHRMSIWEAAEYPAIFQDYMQFSEESDPNIPLELTNNYDEIRYQEYFQPITLIEYGSFQNKAKVDEEIELRGLERLKSTQAINNLTSQATSLMKSTVTSGFLSISNGLSFFSGWGSKPASQLALENSPSQKPQ